MSVSLSASGSALLDIFELQRLIAKEPEAYEDDFLAQVAHFRTQLDIVSLNPGGDHPNFVQLLRFVSGTAHLFQKQVKAAQAILANNTTNNNNHNNNKNSSVPIVGSRRKGQKPSTSSTNNNPVWLTLVSFPSDLIALLQSKPLPSLSSVSSLNASTAIIQQSDTPIRLHHSIRTEILAAISRLVVNGLIPLRVFFNAGIELLTSQSEEEGEHKFRSIVLSTLAARITPQVIVKEKSWIHNTLFSVWRRSELSSSRERILDLAFHVWETGMQDEKIVDLIGQALLVPHSVLVSRALNFFLSPANAKISKATSKTDNENNPSGHKTEDEKMPRVLRRFVNVMGTESVPKIIEKIDIELSKGKHVTRKRLRKWEKMRRLAKYLARAKEKMSNMEDESALDLSAQDSLSEKHRTTLGNEKMSLIRDPQSFAERLFAQLNLNSAIKKFSPLRLKYLDLLSRLIGFFDLVLPGFYEFFEPFLQPSQLYITKILAIFAQSVHDLVPASEIAPLLRKIATTFVDERRPQREIIVGLNAIREICARQPAAMDRTLLQDLVSFRRRGRKIGSKGVSTAARGLLMMYRNIAPGMLDKKDRGKKYAQVEESALPTLNEFGSSRSVSTKEFEDAYYLMREEQEQNADSESEEEDDTVSDDTEADLEGRILRGTENESLDKNDKDEEDKNDKDEEEEEDDDLAGFEFEEIDEQDQSDEDEEDEEEAVDDLAGFEIEEIDEQDQSDEFEEIDEQDQSDDEEEEDEEDEKDEKENEEEDDETHSEESAQAKRSRFTSELHSRLLTEEDFKKMREARKAHIIQNISGGTKGAIKKTHIDLARTALGSTDSVVNIKELEGWEAQRQEQNEAKRSSHKRKREADKSSSGLSNQKKRKTKDFVMITKSRKLRAKKHMGIKERLKRKQDAKVADRRFFAKKRRKKMN